MSPVRLLVLQGTPFCNIACAYCYLPNREKRFRMNEKVIRAVAEKILRPGVAADKLSILWHAGEPLTLPISFYERAFDILIEACPPQVRLAHRIQTNGMLLNPQWCALLQKYGVEVGISLDGPQALHDKNRITRRGSGTFAKTMAGVELLRRFDIPFHVIAVLTRSALTQPDHIFDFFEQLKPTRVHFNIEEIEGINMQTSLNFETVEAEFTRFFDTYWDLIESRNSEQHVREIQETICAIINYANGKPAFNDLTTAFACLTITHDGGVSTFSPELASSHDGRFIFGNILHDDLEAIMRSARFYETDYAIKLGVKNCQTTCTYFRLCGGGSPSNKLSENHDFASTQTIYCKLRVQRLVDLALSRLARTKLTPTHVMS
jgi:uncharacterized protein